jgi:hypothetical protein
MEFQFLERSPSPPEPTEVSGGSSEAPMGTWRPPPPNSVCGSGGRDPPPSCETPLYRLAWQRQLQRDPPEIKPAYPPAGGRCCEDSPHTPGRPAASTRPRRPLRSGADTPPGRSGPGLPPRRFDARFQVSSAKLRATRLNGVAGSSDEVRLNGWMRHLSRVSRSPCGGDGSGWPVRRWGRRCHRGCRLPPPW